MRSLVILMVLASGLLLMHSGIAHAEPCHLDDYGVIVCEDSVTTVGGGPPGGGGDAGPANANVGRRLMYEVFDNDPENFCTRVVYEDYGDPALAAAANASSASTLQEIQGLERV